MQSGTSCKSFRRKGTSGLATESDKTKPLRRSVKGERPAASGRASRKVSRATSGKAPRKRPGAASAANAKSGSYATVKRFAPVAAALAIVCLLIAVFATTCSRHAIPEGPTLPAYITDDMLEAAMDMQDKYGHPAGCTIAQIIQESGAGDTPSALAARDHNLFGMKWDDYYADKKGVVGPVTWDTNEEYDGQIVGISGTFIAFTDDVACIKFRSSVFLQSERYRTNPVIQEAIETGSSATMAYGLADAGWATDSSYADSLVALMDEYDLYRFDK